MEILRQIMLVLTKPFPIQESPAAILKITTIVSIFVTVFLLVFQPFGISNLGQTSIGFNKFLFCLGFGVTSFVATVFYEFVLIKALPLNRDSASFTFWKWICYVLGLLLIISLANFLFARSLFGTIRWELFPAMMKGTFAVGLFPVVILGWISVVRGERKYAAIATEINNRKDGSTQVSHAADLTLFDIPVSEIRYVKALQNYVQIGYVNLQRQLVEQTERATLKLILDETKGSPIVKCHKSFLVNRQSITGASGNAQGLLLSLADYEDKIPVSRSYVAAFR